MTNYLCRTMLAIEANDPVEAAEEYQRQLDEIKPEDRVYRIEDEYEQMTYVYRGEAYTLRKLQEHVLPPDEVERIQAAQAAAQED